ncbi:MAG: NAD(P)H-hydrate dehydratase [bacterium]
MRVLSVEESRAMDGYAIEGLKIPGIVLMENAGRNIAQYILENYGDRERPVIVAGRGNNGGDGFVVARHLFNRGVNPKIVLLGECEGVRGDARVNLDIARAMGIPIFEVRGEEVPDEAREWILESDLIVDAMLGTGSKGAPRGAFAEIIPLINGLGKPIVAVDIPSGLDGDTGATPGVCVRATDTVTMVAPKPGLLLFPGAKNVGRLKVVDIGAPAPKGGSMELVEPHQIAELLPRRERDAHKNTCGRIVIVAGRLGMTGAAALASLATLRSGAGLTILATPRSVAGIMEEKLTEVIIHPLPETPDGAIASEAIDEILRLAERAHCVALGPGISVTQDTVKLVEYILERVPLPVVLDADGLNSLASYEDLTPLKRRKAPCILTPHWGEMARLRRITTEEVRDNQIGIARSTARDYGAIVALKGARTITTDGNAVYFNSTGNAGMATAGSGDVLTGAIAGFTAQGAPPLQATVLGVYIHGLAGDLAAREKGEAGMIAGDILEKLPEAIICALRNTG